MNPSPYRSADDRFPYLAHLKVGGFEFDFMMVSERSENWYGKGEGHGEYLGLIEPGNLVVDAGANEGYTAILAALKAGPSGTVMAFEPAEHNKAPLLINVSLNQMWSRVLLNPCALSEDTQPIRFGGESAQTCGETLIPAMRLDDYYLHCLDVLKLDIEGFEIKALRGAQETIAKFRPKILLELHLDGPTGADLRNYGDKPEDLITFCDFHRYKILRDGNPVTEAAQLSSGVMVLKPL